MTDAAMQQVNEPQAKLPRDQERDVTVSVERDRDPHPRTISLLSSAAGPEAWLPLHFDLGEQQWSSHCDKDTLLSHHCKSEEKENPGQLSRIQ